MKDSAHTEIMSSREAVVRDGDAYLKHLARHADAVAEMAASGRITRTEAIDELLWLYNTHARADVNGLCMRAGARLPTEGTGVMQY